MEEQKDNLKDFFHQHLHNFEVQPPEAVWEKIAVATQRKKRTLYIWRAAAAVALLFALAVPVSMLFFSQQPPQSAIGLDLTPSDNSLQPTNDTKTLTTNQASENNLMKPASTETALIQAKSSNPTAVARAKKTFDANQMAFVSSENVEMIASVEQPLSSGDGLPVENEMAQPTNFDNVRQAEMLLAEKILKQIPDFVLDEQREKELIQKSKMNVALAYGSVPGGTVTANELLYRNNNVKYRNDAFQNDIAYETTFYEEVERTDIRPPLTLGLKFSYRLSKRISLETGITYTTLSVLTKTVEIEANYSEYLRSLHYIGLPLGMRFDVWQSKSFKGYLQQSVIVEKGITAVNKSMRFENKALTESSQNSMPIPGFQLSTLSSLGGDVNIYQRLSIYGEAGVQVFYLNSTQPFNMRSAKMLWPVFQTGIRLNF